MLSAYDIGRQFSPEVGFLVLCCRVYLKTTGIDTLRTYVAEQHIDWRHVLKLARYHSLRPIIHNVVSAGVPGVGEKFADRLRDQSMQVAKENLARLKEVTRINNAFCEKGITIVPYKGLLLSYLLHGDYASRESSDIDMLILPKDFLAASQILATLGYKSAEQYNHDFEGYLVHTDRELKFRREIDNKRIIKLELQWRPHHKLMGIPISSEQLFVTLRKIEVPGGTTNTLSLENELLTLISHHGVAEIWRKLKLVFDLACFIEKYRDDIDWIEFEKKLIDSKLKLFTIAGVNMAEEIFGVKSSMFVNERAGVSNNVVADVLNFPLLSTEKTNLRHLSRHLELIDGLRERILFLKRYATLWLMPNMQDIGWVRLPKRLFPLYFLIRRFRFLRTIGSGK
ncbi:MAG: hypothetical protein EOP56_00675 [Sphingobacteriales bacterium]|nr:MAG: hypothetical protein EOP56_00675 [Sphingobacteriales bacterium]